MVRVLVTGGTGVLGRHVVPRLVGSGAEVRVLSHRPEAQPPSGATLVRGELASGEGLTAAVAGADVIVHCASNSRRPEVDREGTRRLLDAARGAGSPHVVYVSIVGVDRIPYGYFHAKLAGETYVREAGLPWTILRATQFHDLVLQLLVTLAKVPVAFVPKGFRVQPVDARDVADRLVGFALGEPAGRAPDFGGPRVEAVEDLMRDYLAAAGRSRRIVSVPVPGKTARAFRSDAHLVLEGPRGERTFAEFLRERVRPGERVDLSYDIKKM